MKYPDYNLAEVQGTLDMYLDIKGDMLPTEFKHNGITKDSPLYTVEEYIRLYDAQTFRISHKEFVRLLTEIKNTNLIDEYSITFINKLIGDRKLFKKIKFCYDGSYRNNRIWGSCNW